MEAKTARSKLWAPLGCLAIPAFLGVSIGVGGDFGWQAGVGAFFILMLGWSAFAIYLGAVRQRAHRAEREAVRAAEIAQHHAYMQAKESERVARYQALCNRFGQRIADAIFAGRYWQGATTEMIRESLGSPVDVREKVFKTKTKTTYCYQPLDARRFALKVHFENGIVVGWED